MFNKDNAEINKKRSQILKLGEYSYQEILDMEDAARNAMPGTTYSPLETLDAISCFAEAKIPVQFSSSLLPVALNASVNSKAEISDIAYELAIHYQHMSYEPAEWKKHVDAIDIRNDAPGSWVSATKFILAFTPADPFVDASEYAKDFFDQLQAGQEKALKDYGDKNIYGKSWYSVFGNGDPDMDDLTPEYLHLKLANIEEDNYLNSIEALNSLLLEGYISGFDMRQTMKDGNSDSDKEQISYADLAMQLVRSIGRNTSEFMENRSTAAFMANMHNVDYEKLKNQANKAEGILISELNAALSNGVIDGDERLKIRAAIESLSETYKKTHDKDNNDDNVIEEFKDYDPFYSAIHLSKENIDFNSGKYGGKDGENGEEGEVGVKTTAKNNADYLHHYSTQLDDLESLYQGEGITRLNMLYNKKSILEQWDDEVTKQINGISERMFRYYKVVFEDNYEELYNIGMLALPELEDFRRNELPAFDFLFRNDALAAKADFLMEGKMYEKGISFDDLYFDNFEQTSDRYLSLFPIAELKSKARYYETHPPAPKWINEAIEFNDLIVMLRKGNAVYDLVKWGENTNQIDDEIEVEKFSINQQQQFENFRSDAASTIERAYSDVAYWLKITGENIRLSFRHFNESIGINFDKHANGGRAVEASIFGEAGPEWAIPERHDARTAELLNSAREASGFSWTELIASTGGLNGGGNVVNNNITYAPVVHANDARGVEDVLSKDKQMLDDWWKQKQWETARTQWA